MIQTIKQYKRPGHKKGRAFFLAIPSSRVQHHRGCCKTVLQVQDGAILSSRVQHHRGCCKTVLQVQDGAIPSSRVQYHRGCCKTIYIIYFIRYTRYRTSQNFAVLEAVGPLFLCVIRYTPYYKITEKSGRPGGLYYIYKGKRKSLERQEGQRR